MDERRVAELYNQKQKTGGTGYLITEGLILTAHHIIAPINEDGILQTDYDVRFVGDYEQGKVEWLEKGCYLCWDNKELDLALLKLVKGKPAFLSSQDSPATRFGKLPLETLVAKGTDFPVVQKIENRNNPEPLRGNLSRLAAIKEGQLRLEVTSPIPKQADEWKGISGTVLFVDNFLVGVIVETNKSFAEKALWATPISVIAKDPDFCELVLGDRNLSLSLKSLQDSIPDALLIAPKRKLDAWRRFFEPTKLVGREAELRRLEDFIQRPEPFIWQVLYGQHGVGKSRLAKEWLIQLQSNNPQWTVGFAPDEVNELYQLLNYRPSQATAIVIDNAENFGGELWAFLYRAQLSWKDYGNVIRILFLAHTDLEPLSTNFERDQSLKELRESRLGEVKEVGTQLQSVKATELIPVSGIPLYPLQDQKQQKHILGSSGDNSISEYEVQKLIDDTKGLPAFLGLAGRYPQTWNEKLKDYAKVIVEQAKRLFGEENGVCVLALSTFIAPIDSSILERLAPKTWSAKKMEQLFGINQSILKKEVPVFEPDLLGQEIVFQALSTLSDSSAESLCWTIAKERPEAFLQKTIEIWQRYVDPQGIVDKFGTDPGSSAAQRASILDILFNAATQIAVHGINLPLGRLSQVRGKAYTFALLNPSLPKNQYSKLVDSVLAQTPIDGVSSYLPALHSEAPCNDSNRLKWVALLHYYFAPLTDEAPSEIETIKLANNNLDEPLITTTLKGLRSPDLFERSFAAYRVAEAMRYDKKSPSELIPDFVGVLYGLSYMLQNTTAAERIAAAFAISMIAREPDGKPGWQHFQDIDTNRLLTIATEHNADRVTLTTTAIALRDLWRSSYQLKALLHLLNVEPRGLSAEFTYDQEIKRKKISETLSFRLRQNSDKNYHNFRIAFECLRLDCFNSYTVDQLIWGLSFPVTSQVEKIEIIVRANRQSGENVIPFLQQSAMLQNEQLQTISVACLAQRRAAKEIATLKAKELVKATDIDLINLIDEVRFHKNRNAWNEENVSKLREHIKEIYVANNGLNIHKLKAKDSTGRWAYYFVLVEPEREKEFLAALDSNQSIDLEDYGQVVASNYGETPSDDIRDFLKQKYNFTV